MDKRQAEEVIGLDHKDQVGEGQFFCEQEVGEAMEALEEAEAEKNRMEQEQRDKCVLRENFRDEKVTD